MRNFWACLLLTIVFFACKKEALVDNINKNDVDLLTGTYVGISAEYNYSSAYENTLLHIDSMQQYVTIQKSTTFDQAIVLNATVTAYPTPKRNEYEEFVLFQSNLCNGTEKYKLIFDQDNEQLTIELEKNSYCPDGKTRIISIFNGSKSKD